MGWVVNDCPGSIVWPHLYKRTTRRIVPSFNQGISHGLAQYISQFVLPIATVLSGLVKNLEDEDMNLEVCLTSDRCRTSNSELPDD